MPSVLTTMAALQEAHGADIGGIGLALPARARLPAGILAYDIATGGGIPLNALTLVYGARSSGKTLLATCLMREWQLRYPKKRAVLVEPEGDYDTDWAKKCGVNTGELGIFRPEYLEQCADIVVAMLEADDCGLLVLDSLAAAASMHELEKSAEDNPRVGGNSRHINTLCKRVGNKFIRAQKAGRQVTMVWINQPRMNASGYGNPETLPGGKGQEFFSKQIVRLYGKPKIVKEAHPEAPSLLEVSGQIMRAKHVVGAQTFKYDMVVRAHKGLEPGRCNDWPPFKKYAAAMGLMQKGKGCWELVDPGDGTVAEYGTQKELWDDLRADTPRWDRTRQAIIDRVVA